MKLSETYERLNRFYIPLKYDYTIRHMKRYGSASKKLLQEHVKSNILLSQRFSVVSRISN